LDGRSLCNAYIFRIRLISFSNAAQAILSASSLRRGLPVHEDEMTAMLASTNPPMATEISGRIHDAAKATTAIFRETMNACRRFPSIGQSARVARIEQLLGAGAFTEAALALIDLELPRWRLRRIAYDGGEWYCALSRERELPDWLDQSVEARHHDLALSILAALVEVQTVTAPQSRPSVPASRRETNVLLAAIGCDNFI
jgi:hypothetical protein